MTSLADRLRQAKQSCRLQWQRLTSGPRTLVLAYHRVAELERDPFGLAVSPLHFAEHLEVVAAYGRPIPFRNIQSERVQHGSICITFDDGYADNLYNARPLLEKRDMPATVFVVAGQMGSSEEFWWDELDGLLSGLGATFSEVRKLRDALYDAQSGLREAIFAKLRGETGGVGHAGRNNAVMRPDEVRQIADGGLIDIGAHTVTHPRLPTLPDAAQTWEIVRSKQMLEAVLGRDIVSFAYPFGSWVAKTADLVRDAGFQLAATVEGGTLSRSSDPFAIPRMLVHDCTGDQLARTLRAVVGEPSASRRR
jgi:peptidoglycan/xylan/chitin deacetylase (PgdA/CDA1 family)